ncbi:MAG: type II toxin-antitoxin system prevent-host-death family antitoxin [Azonexus sp.]|jgi:prevent-host-death family protein|nr:type II toxin-antitoxin system prevent-host-death family antitoxin [Azonexus sp.]
MQTVNIYEAKTQFSRLIEAAERGEEIVIARAGQPVAMISAYSPKRKIAAPGSMQGSGWRMHENFDESVEALFDCLQDAGKPS